MGWGGRWEKAQGAGDICIPGSTELEHLSTPSSLCSGHFAKTSEKTQHLNGYPEQVHLLWTSADEKVKNPSTNQKVVLP